MDKVEAAKIARICVEPPDEPMRAISVPRESGLERSHPPESNSRARGVVMAVAIAGLVFAGGLAVFVLGTPSGSPGRVTIGPAGWTASWVGYNASYGVPPPTVSAPAVGPGFCPSVNSSFPAGAVIQCWLLLNLTQSGPGQDEIGGIYVNLTAPFFVTTVLADWDHFCPECYSWDLSIQLPSNSGVYSLGGTVGVWGGPG